MINWLELLKNIAIIFFLLGIIITIIICHLESKSYERRKSNNSTGARIMYAHEEDAITEDERDRLETLFKIMKVLIIIAVTAIVLYSVIGLTTRFNIMFSRMQELY